MGSICFAKPRNTAPAPAVPGGGIAAAQRPVSPPGRGRSQRIAFTRVIVCVFPMTMHAECVALLEKSGSDLR
jgi:hypothetical protein